MPEPFEVRQDWRRVFREKRTKTLLLVSAGLLVALTGLVALYQIALGPKDSASTDTVRVIVESGESVTDIAKKLKEYELIKSETAFRIYSELTNTKSKLQAGAYALSQNLSVPDIIDHMSTGKTDEFNVRIVPGLTLRQQYDRELQGSLAQQGFSEEEIDAALQRDYDHPFLQKRPSGSTLEGYIYPDTYRVTASNDLSVVFGASFDELNRVLTENNIEQQLAAKNLTLHEGFTLASIIQKEVSEEKDQAQVAQVFLKRLAEDMPLQSDPTFIYGARLVDETPSVSHNSPYNTYLQRGLPPGPIANFNLSALLAVINPAAGDFLYFVADNQGVTHFARSLEEHEANVSRYCTDHCNDF